MVRKFGVLALLLIASTSSQAAQEPAAAVPPARPMVAPAPAPLDLSGSWVGMIVIPTKDKRAPSSLHAVLKHSGVTLTGTAGSSDTAQTAFTNARVESTRFGTALTFNLPGPNVVMEFQLRLEGGVLKGVARLPGVTATAPVELRRVDSNARAKAPNVSGTWIGAFNLANSEQLLHVVLEQSGATITGTAGPYTYRQLPITKGKVATTEAATSVSFQMDMPDDVVMVFELALTDTGLKGTVTLSRKGEEISGTVELTPTK